MLSKSKNIIIQIIDFFYFPFLHKFIPIQTFRYLVCGGSNAVLGVLLFGFAHNFIFKDEFIDFGFIHMTRYIASFAFSLVINFPIGFILNKFVVFQTSHLKGRVQLFRYALIACLNIIFNYLLLHFFVGVCGFWATPSQALTTIILALVSYFAQNYFTFRSKQPKNEI